MADKGWTARMATAAGVAAGTGAAQLGLGYGLGVVVWPVASTADRSVWLGSLGWATWITASATVFGAIIARRLAGPERPRGPLAAIFAISAGIGALVAVALIALPARDAVRLEAHSPQTIAAGYALIGVALGVAVAYWAVRSRPVGANLIATAAWLWALAITTIVTELTLHRDSATYLTSWQFAEATAGGRYGTIYWPSAVLTVGAAFLIGVIAAAPATRRGDLGVAAATSGAVGPLLVAASFLVLAPRLTGDRGPLESAYLIAPYAVLAGLAGSAMTIAAARSLADRRAPSPPEAEDPDSDALPASWSPTASAPPTERPRRTTGGAPSPRRASAAPSGQGSAAQLGSTATAGPSSAANEGPSSAANEGPSSAANEGPSSAADARSSRASASRPAAVPPPGAAPAAGSPGATAAASPAAASPRGAAAAPPGPAAPQPGPAGAKSAPGARSKPTSAAIAAERTKPAPAKRVSAPTARTKRDTPEPTPIAPARTPKPINDPPQAPPAATDPEIAAAARPTRGRKAAPQPVKPADQPADAGNRPARPTNQPARNGSADQRPTTVTPPPRTPTVARINPDPPTDR